VNEINNQSDIFKATQIESSMKNFESMTKDTSKVTYFNSNLRSNYSPLSKIQENSKDNIN
jgi:hypothetical protein